MEGLKVEKDFKPLKGKLIANCEEACLCNAV